MWTETINSEAFLNQVEPALRDGRPEDLAERVAERWSATDLCQMLQHESADVRKAACVAMALTGNRRTISCLTAALWDEDASVNQLAEYALWSIWFRGGTPEAQGCFKRGLAALDQDRPADAAHWFNHAHMIDPTFAEAYNQCAIAHFMIDEYAEAIDDSKQAIALMPCHFGALAGLGHCYAQIGSLAEAAHYYRRALQINPRLDAIATALHRIERSVHASQPY